MLSALSLGSPWCSPCAVFPTIPHRRTRIVRAVRSLVKPPCPLCRRVAAYRPRQRNPPGEEVTRGQYMRSSSTVTYTTHHHHYHYYDELRRRQLLPPQPCGHHSLPCTTHVSSLVLFTLKLSRSNPMVALTACPRSPPAPSRDAMLLGAASRDRRELGAEEAEAEVAVVEEAVGEASPAQRRPRSLRAFCSWIILRMPFCLTARDRPPRILYGVPPPCCWCGMVDCVCKTDSWAWSLKMDFDRGTGATRGCQSSRTPHALP